MQLPAHSCWPAGHVPPHVVPSQVAVPPEGAEQGVHEVPHELVLVSLTQLDAQSW